MKKVLLTFVLLVGIASGLFAQKLTYQAAIRDNNRQLVTNTAVKATVTIDFAAGEDPTWTVDATTNLHGLLTFEFGDDALIGRDWTDATIAVRVVNADDESTVYVGGDARPVSAVPYALSVDGKSIQNYLDEKHYVDLAKLNDTLGAYPTTTAMDGRHYLTSDSAAITGMQNDISKNAGSIDKLILHTAKAAIRDSVAGQIHDSIANIADKSHTHDNKALLDTYTQTEANLADAVAKKHAHDNAAILNNTTATYTDADSAKLKGDISKNAGSIDKLILHTAKAAIRDSVAGQIRDSIAPVAAKAHTHANKTLLDNTTATYTYADSAKLDGIAEGAEVNVQSDWKQTDNAKDDFIKNKPSIRDTVNGILTAGQYVTAVALDARHYLTSDSAVIKTMKNDISKNAGSIDKLILHTAKAAIRDSVAGQVHDSIANIAAKAHTHGNKALLDTYKQTEANLADAVSKKHAHANMSVLNATQAPYTDADSAKLKGIAAGAEVNVQSDWSVTNTSSDAYIKNKPTKVSAFSNDAGYLTNDSVKPRLTEIDKAIDRLTREIASLKCPKVKDVDGNEYNTVLIGNQCWMAENLRTTKYADNTSITLITSTATSSTTAYRYNPNGQETNVSTYGYLYNWQAVTKGNTSSATPSGVQGICPEGWHVPSDAEWDTLTYYVYNSANPNYKCSGCTSSGWERSTKCIANALSGGTWNTPDTCGAGHSSSVTFNKTGFSAVPAGYRFVTGLSSSFGESSDFWSATQYDATNARYLYLYNTGSYVARTYSYKVCGYSVRCLKDAE